MKSGIDNFEHGGQRFLARRAARAVGHAKELWGQRAELLRNGTQFDCAFWRVRWEKFEGNIVHFSVIFFDFFGLGAAARSAASHASAAHGRIAELDSIASDGGA